MRIQTGTKTETTKRLCFFVSEEYIKVQYVAKQTVRSTLSDNRQLLKIALLSIIESLRSDPTKFILSTHHMSSTMGMSKSNMIDYAGSSSGYHTNPFSYSPNQGGYDETLAEVLVNEAAILYKKMGKDFTFPIYHKVFNYYVLKNPFSHFSPKAGTESYVNWYDKENPSISEYIKNRLEPQINWYNNKAKSNTFRYHVLQFLTIGIASSYSDNKCRWGRGSGSSYSRESGFSYSNNFCNSG